MWTPYGRKTREIRRKVNAPGWIAIGGIFGLHKCTVIDMSMHGAQLRLDRPTALPRDFTLLLTLNDRRGRRCELVWREGAKAGVKFVR